MKENEDLNCIFCKIVKKELPSYQITENKEWIAILDIAPITKGHCLLITKKHFRNFLEVDKDTLKTGDYLIQEVCQQMKKKLNAKGFNIGTNVNREANQIIFHMHWHIIPRYDTEFKHLSGRIEVKEEELKEIESILKFKSNC